VTESKIWIFRVFCKNPNNLKLRIKKLKPRFL